MFHQVLLLFYLTFRHHNIENSENEMKKRAGRRFAPCPVSRDRSTLDILDTNFDIPVVSVSVLHSMCLSTWKTPILLLVHSIVTCTSASFPIPNKIIIPIGTVESFSLYLFRRLLLLQNMRLIHDFDTCKTRHETPALYISVSIHDITHSLYKISKNKLLR